MEEKKPAFKESPDSRTCPVDWKPFSDEPLKGYPVEEGEDGIRKGFTKRQYVTPCGEPKFGRGLAG